MINFADFARPDLMVYPEFLIGTEREVTRRWKSYAKSVWEGKMDSTAEIIKYAELPKDFKIVIANASDGKINEPHVRLDMIQSVSFTSFPELRVQPNRHALIVFDYMKHFWFALGVSGNSYNSFYFTRNIDAGESIFIEGEELAGEAFYRSWFKKYVNWIPELTILSNNVCKISPWGGAHLTSCDYITFWHVALSAKICDYRKWIGKSDFNMLLNRLYNDGAIDIVNQQVVLS
ncbi:MAG: hypothetical protein SFX18_17090 [Pirellulales bacterium]|nr:hypothetical protein [Pirellulales bacterium]